MAMVTTNWVKLKSGAEEAIVEDNGDGTYTSWAFSMWGPCGTRGPKNPDVVVLPIKSKKDRKEVEDLERRMERSFDSQVALFVSMGGSMKVHEEWEATKAARKPKSRTSA